MKGYVQVYTGNGKGKTTAAIGLAIRAVGAGKKVLLLQFMKSKVYSEHAILPAIEGITVKTVGKPFFIAKEGALTAEELDRWGGEVVIFPPGNPPADYVELISKGYDEAINAVSSGTYDVVILDEYNMALYYELLSWEQTSSLIDAKKESVELIFTGRGAPEALLDRADLVTEMREVKHYYSMGVDARLGIEN